jgi:hypothetical protein
MSLRIKEPLVNRLGEIYSLGRYFCLKSKTKWINRKVICIKPWRKGAHSRKGPFKRRKGSVFGKTHYQKGNKKPQGAKGKNCFASKRARKEKARLKGGGLKEPFGRPANGGVRFFYNLIFDSKSN